MATNSTVLSKCLTSLSMNKDDHQNLNRSISTNTHDDRIKVEVRMKFNQTLTNWHELQEICELENSYANATTISLMRCKRQILHPFRNILCLIGWRPFGLDSVRRSSLFMRILNIIYPIFIFTLLLFNYVYEIIVCQGKIKGDDDAKGITTTTSGPRLQTNLNTTMTNMRPHTAINHAGNVTECGHIVTMYVIPDILHCAAFVIGFIYFRTTEGEPMYSLMEKVFIHADHNMPLFSPNRVIRRLKMFLIIACGWVFASVVVHALSIIITDFEHHGILHDLTDSNRKSVQYTVAINFVGHCEMVVFYCKGIRTRLEEKSIPLLEGMKQILDVRLAISQLNGAVSRMMSLLILYFLDRAILGLILFIVNTQTDLLIHIYRGLYPVIWLSILIFCLSQAARLTSKCDKFYRIGHSMRVYGYHSTSPSDLDGFLIFISAAELRAKLFGLTIRPGNVISLIVTIMIACVILIQTDYITSPRIPL